MKKWPKYIVMPVALAVFFVAVLALSIKQNKGKLPDDFAIILIVEVVILTCLFFALKYLHNKRNGL